MKKISTLIALLGLSLLLVACGNLSNSSMQTNSTTGQQNKKSTYQVTGQPSDGQYTGVIKNGHYLTSKARGLTADQNGNINNVESFENGLLDVSKKTFSPDKYVFQEGQYLSSSTVQNWIDRKSKDNPTGLNPTNNGSTDPNKRNPIYLQSLEEQDFMEKTGNSLKIKGMTIGLAMNSIDYYHKEQYGPTFETKISDAELMKQGKAIAQTVLARIRQNKDLKKIPIVIAIYKQASNDSLTGGTFKTYSVNNGVSLDSWKDLDYKNVVFPIKNGASVPSSNDASAFENFQTQVESFFPNLSGVTAQARYNGKSMQGMQVTITTQFYSETEIDSFTQFVADQAQKYLPSGVKIDITVSSSEGIQSFLTRSANERNFSSHVFTSY
ncbi:CamS family sex pheromone protein [Pediococcus claussenii]|uniref:Lipoprotein, pheromone n=1 Tax=Pediococcus claussenii (strain ATCC BAA-344 / DSM 14800 / JCM 18046 / KCTC 3811 / LMG 21948 / P06) TaxID=701521 RepID=G8PE14_PEDCP|nr:CamS family sex pheromone protein [Pediococcus claussenii]AEV95499.1 lipoprotein, pheromone [Pediococcus claussenii ATCC BAA-344]ANZ69023.1 CamS family sex pheromone protein [Pediococcus claussenii]ANZ70839.1 CamS family sex pheromone protein [Pediococcus claussenii]KRN20266.1 hypothetical protein IV79_GL000933 [Pediococcus claussenii]